MGRTRRNCRIERRPFDEFELEFVMSSNQLNLLKCCDKEETEVRMDPCAFLFLSSTTEFAFGLSRFNVLNLIFSLYLART